MYSVAADSCTEASHCAVLLLLLLLLVVVVLSSSQTFITSPRHAWPDMTRLYCKLVLLCSY